MREKWGRGGGSKEGGERREGEVSVCVPMYMWVHHIWYTCAYTDI